MTYTNIEMERMAAALKPLLGRKGLLGYAAARNTRVLQGEIAEYVQAKDAAISELGDEVLDADGNPTGQIELRFDSPAFAEYERRMAGIGEAESEPRIFAVKASDVMDDMTGEEMLAVEWMLRFEDEDA